MTFSVEIANKKEIDKGKHHVEIYIDSENLESLIACLKLLREQPSDERKLGACRPK